MALTPQDRAFYQEKLGWLGFLYLLIVTVLVGAVMWPALLYLQDYLNGQAGRWNFKIVFNVAISGMLLGCVVSVIMFALARLYLRLGWLPRRREK